MGRRPSRGSAAWEALAGMPRSGGIPRGHARTRRGGVGGKCSSLWLDRSRPARPNAAVECRRPATEWSVGNLRTLPVPRHAGRARPCPRGALEPVTTRTMSSIYALSSVPERNAGDPSRPSASARSQRWEQLGPFLGPSGKCPRRCPGERFPRRRAPLGAGAALSRRPRPAADWRWTWGGLALRHGPRTRRSAGRADHAPATAPERSRCGVKPARRLSATASTTGGDGPPFNPRFASTAPGRPRRDAAPNPTRHGFRPTWRPPAATAKRAPG